MSMPYTDYKISISDVLSKDSVHYDAPGHGGRLARFTHNLHRIPSEKRFIVNMFHDATEQDRQFAERTLSNHLMLYAQSRDLARRDRRKDGTYVFSIAVGQIVGDPMVQLELEMMIDLSSAVTA